MADKYLIVDDSPTVQLTLKKMLEGQGIREADVLVAGGGEEGLELFKEHEPAVVFMDIAMPDMDGEEATTAMLNERPLTKIVVISGASRDEDHVRRLISRGAYEFIEKPIRQAQIKELFSLIAAEEGRVGRIR